MKCELCHKGEAKHQAYRKDGDEVYVCEDCFNKLIDDAARACLEEAPTEDCFEGVEELHCEQDDPFAISTAAAAALVELRNRLGKPIRLSYSRDVEGTNIDAKVRFDNIQKNITLRFAMKNPSEEERNAESEWVFNLTDKKAIAMKAWCHMGSENSVCERRYRFTEKNAPPPALMTLVAILGGLISSRDDLICDFD